MPCYTPLPCCTRLTLHLGTRIAQCKQDYNYPCSWANAEGLVGHVQSMLFMEATYTLDEAFDLATTSPEYGGDAQGTYKGMTALSTNDWLYPFIYDFESATAVAHGARPDFVGRTLHEIIGSSPTLSAVLDGRELHEQFKDAANNGGGWVAYSWKNLPTEPVVRAAATSATPATCACDSPPSHHAMPLFQHACLGARRSQYLKVAFIVKVRRGGRDFYLGVGLGDNDWKVHGERVDSASDTANDGDLGVGGGLSRWLFACSPDYQHPCAEDWAVQIVGHAMAGILTATSHTAMKEALESTPPPSSTMGFALHVHNSEYVLYDRQHTLRADAKPALGVSTAEWTASVGLSGDWRCPDPKGSWVGPLELSRTMGSVRSKHYIYCTIVTLNDKLADGFEDGAFDAYTLLVMVGADKPLPTLSLEQRDSRALSEVPEDAPGGIARSSGALSEVPELLTMPPGKMACVERTSSSSQQDVHCEEDWSRISEMQVSSNGVIADETFERSRAGSNCVREEPVLNGVDPLGDVSAAKHTRFCMCQSGWDLRYAQPLVLGAAGAGRDDAELQADAICSVNFENDTTCGVGTACGELQMTYAQICVLADQPIDHGWIAAAIAVPICVVLLLAAFCVWRQRRKIAKVRKELDEFKGKMFNVCAATADYDPREHPNYWTCRSAIHAGCGATSAPASAPSSASASLYPAANAPQSTVQQMEVSRWYWQEDAQLITKHNSRDVKQPGNWVSYASSVCRELDKKYHAWKNDGGKQVVTIDLCDRISSTGTEQKVHKNDTGVVFTIDLLSLKQRNTTSGFERKVLREFQPVTGVREACEASEWECPACTYVHEGAEACYLACSLCGSERPEARSARPAQGSTPKSTVTPRAEPRLVSGVASGCARYPYPYPLPPYPYPYPYC